MPVKEKSAVSIFFLSKKLLSFLIPSTPSSEPGYVVIFLVVIVIRVVVAFILSSFIFTKTPPVNVLQDVFRPFPGYIEVRLIKKETKSGRQFYLCFVDFENPLQATIALHTLQVSSPLNFVSKFSLLQIGLSF